MKSVRYRIGQASQQGMVLLLCLIFMTSLTLLGLTATTDTITQRQLASNLLDAERTRQAGQLALQWAENWLLESSGPAPAICSSSCTGFYAHPVGSLVANIQSEDAAMWQALGFEAGVDPATGARLATLPTSGANPAMWIIQNLHHSAAASDGSTPELDWYRILVRATGQSETSVSVVESVVSKSWAEDETATAFSKRVAWQELR